MCSSWLTSRAMNLRSRYRGVIRRFNVTACCHDVWEILDESPKEVEGLLEVLRDGGINGSVYSGDNGTCLIGTLAKLKGESLGVRRNPSRPAERLFCYIDPGSTPNRCRAAALAEEIIVAWLMENGRLPRFDQP